MPINKNILVHVIKRYEDGSVIRAKGPDGEFYPCARTDEKKSHTYIKARGLTESSLAD